MKKFKIHFSRNRDNKIFSRILQWYEGLPISHVLIEFDTPHLGQNFVYHSVIGNGVSLLTKKKFDKLNIIVETYEIQLEEEQYSVMRNALLDNCGEHYAMMQNIGIFIVDLMRRKGISISNPWKDGQNCSELIYRLVVPYLGLDTKLDYEADLVKPSDIRKLLKSNEHRPIFTKIQD